MTFLEHSLIPRNIIKQQDIGHDLEIQWDIFPQSSKQEALGNDSSHID